MAGQQGTLEVLATSVANLLRPLEERVGSGQLRLLVAELGLQFPATLDLNANVTTAARTAIQRLRDLPVRIADLAAAVDDEDIAAIVSKGLELGNTVKNVVEGIEAVAGAIRNVAGSGIPAAELNAFADALPRRLVDYLAVRTLESIPGAAESLEFIGAVTRTEVPSTDPQHPEFVRRELDLDQLTSFIGDPLGQLGDLYQWGEPGFEGTPLLTRLHSLVTRAGVPAVLATDVVDPTVPVLDLLFAEVKPNTGIGGGLVIDLTQKISVDVTPFQQDDFQLRAILNAPLDPGVEVTITPDDGVTFAPAPGGARVEGDLMIEFIGGSATGTPYLILGQAGGSRLEAQQLVARAGAGFAWSSAANRGEGSLSIAGEVRQGKLVVDLSGADGFLGTLLSGFGLESDFNLGLGFSTRDGLFFTGSATLDIQIPLHLELGPVEISGLTLSVGVDGNTFPIGIAADIKAALGPLQAVVQQIGVEALLSIPDDRKGNAGPVDVAIGFKPPTGVGLSLDAVVLKGGGFLFFDDERGEYGGALELTFANFLSIKAIGLINTRLPDGTPGFSLIIIISVEFGTGIQLGFGFTLLGIGGIVGLNRGFNSTPLVEGVTSGSVNNLLFPTDIVANAPRILSDIRVIFPAEQGTFLIGPFLKIGWGTPTLVSLTIGVLFEIPPGNPTLLGVLRIMLPTEQAALIKLQMAFIGSLEIDKKRLWFFAGLFDSRIITIPLQGEMGLLIAYGDDANFVISLGGFHPSFNPPPLPFPTPRRIAIVIFNTPVARVRVEAYFAITSNTVQFGARAELFFGIDAANVQGHIAFDALFQFSPFRFVITISASFSLSVFGIGLFSVRIRGQFEGTSPYRCAGEGSISLLFWDISADFEVTWGESRDTSLPPVAVLPLLQTDVDKKENWRALPPAGNNLLVALRKLPESETLVLHPVGVLRVSQRAVPLDLGINKVGAQAASDVNRLSINVAGGGLAKKGDIDELFAPAQYQNFSDSEKLSRPAYTKQHGGLELSASGEDTRSSRCVERIVRYEQIILDNNYKRFQRRFFGFTGILFGLYAAGGAVSLSELSFAKKKQQQPFADKIGVGEDTYAVAFQSNNQAYNAAAISFDSEASARDFMTQEVANNPNLADAIHVIPTFEAAA
jgi:hypothetical protein